MSQYVEIEVPDHFPDANALAITAGALRVRGPFPSSRDHLIEAMRGAIRARWAHNWRCNSDEPDVWAPMQGAIDEAQRRPQGDTHDASREG